MGKLVRSHLPCTRCGSSDALSEYEKNTYCFSCGTSTPTKRVKSLFLTEDEVAIGDNTIRLPSQCSNRMGKDAEQWLLKFNIHKDLRTKYNIKYVHWGRSGNIVFENRVILPAYKAPSYNELDFYQARALTPGDEPKYYTVGSKANMFWSRSEDKGTVVLVEDMLSAIRVGEHVQAVSLIGTSAKMENILHLSENYATIIIWMDGDREGQKAAKKLMSKFKLVTNNVHNIVTKRDPKCLFDGEIRKHVGPYIR